MKTLIELYEARAIENVIAPETFKPECVVYLCPAEVIQNRDCQEKLARFYTRRGLHCRLVFLECSQYRTDKLLSQLKRVCERYRDCAIDVTGGSDAALFAAGMFCHETGTPAFTYSRRQNRFYQIFRAPYADRRVCTLSYTVADFFSLAGGTLREGRVDNRVLTSYMADYDPFFRVYLKHRRGWTDAVTYFQRISQPENDAEPTVHAEGAWIQKGEKGRTVRADVSLLNDLREIGFIRNLKVAGDESVAFDFRDLQIRTWLRDVGSVLELYMYKACRDADIFGDVVSSAVVDWDPAGGMDGVTNEIDAVAARGTVPLFISCKTCEIKTEALNELSILRDRFGGKGAKAAIVTTERCGAAARHRAAQLEIAVIDLEELESGRAADRLRVIMKVDKEIPIS